ncbi:hypothetical protein HGH93_15345 [Chitinophaga polysaccharea]|uniref:hypothetical protein n=1 Tax=Chitinophaga polysaccharea TaxID=1293035 RepID=UPI00145550C8|nr:hypothetical protein [Chitinophaga polysaccharea]NLR59490.1 hypothetical protein [Chitinophaga polysaccharea]
MAKADILVRLINTLTKAEKRYFRLHSSLQRGSKDYVKLFDLLERHSYKNATAVKKAFHEQYPRISFEVCSKYLYKVIMDCLLYLHLQHNDTARLTSGLLKTDILFQKSLYEEGYRQLRKIQETARTSEKQELLLWALKQEMQVLQQLNFPYLPEKSLLKKQQYLQGVLQDIGQQLQHTALYEQLRYQWLYKGAVRTAGQKEALNHLVERERQTAGKTQEAIRTHLMFQAHYALITGYYETALQHFRTLNNMLETRGHLNTVAPIDHLQVLEGMLDSLRSTRRYRELSVFLEKVRQFKSDAPYLDVMTQRLVFIYELASHIDSGNFAAALALQKKQAPALLKKIHLLDVSQQAEIYLYLSLVHLGNEDINSAHENLEIVLQQSALYSNLPIFRTFKLIHLLLHYELGNYEYIRYETRAFRRHLHADNKRSFLLEKTIIKFLRNERLFTISTRPSNLWKKMSSNFDKIKEDKYEMQLLKLFDFSAWIEAKLKRKPLGKILREKYEAELADASSQLP